MRLGACGSQALRIWFWLEKKKLQISPLTLPRISCGTWWLRQTSCAFLYGKAHTQHCLVQRGRKSGFAPVGMTLYFEIDDFARANRSTWRPTRALKRFRNYCGPRKVARGGFP